MIHHGTNLEQKGAVVLAGRTARLSDACEAHKTARLSIKGLSTANGVHFGRSVRWKPKLEAGSTIMAHILNCDIRQARLQCCYQNGVVDRIVGQGYMVLPCRTERWRR